LKIAHLADTHIRNYRYHKEYRQIFDQIYDRLKEEEVDYIVHCGDLAHTKTQLSPEYFDLATSFLKSLADIAPTYIILGNHDGNLKNEHRQDAITPIAKALNHPRLHLLKNAGEVAVRDDLIFNVLSVFDEDNWTEPTDSDKINIALYHGSVSGVKTDTGWVMKYGDHSIEIFEGHDYAFLGDIHKTNQILDEEGRVRYPGSTVQQNFGETNDKGFLLWNIQGKEAFTCEHVVIQNPKPFVTINLTPTGRMPRGLNVKRGSRLRLVSNNNLSLEAMRKAIDVAKHRFKPDTITFLNRAAGERGNVEELTENLHRDDMRSPEVQEELIREYLTDYNVSEGLMKKVLDLNSEYIKKAEASEEIARNIKWRINELRWDNLFNYGEGNCIAFNKLKGTVGIFGKNYSGKSAIIDSLLYTIFNTTSKNERKNVNIINQNKEEGSGEVVISIGDEQYYINRNSKKYIKRLKGEESLEAKTDLDFFKIDRGGEKVSLNGLTRNDTDKNIRKVFGTIDDFLLTSLSSQLDSLAFIREGSTRRKEILAKFLDLEIFEKKFRLAKDDAANMRGALKRLEGRGYDVEIGEAEEEYTECESRLDDQEALCEVLKEDVRSLTSEKTEIESLISSIPTEIIDIVNVRSQIQSKTVEALSTAAQISEQEGELLEKQEFLEKLEGFLGKFDIDNLTEKEEDIKVLRKDLIELQSGLEQIEKKGELLDGIPCNDSFPSCKFIRDAVVAVANKAEVINEIEEAKEQIESMHPDEVEDYISKYIAVDEKRRQTKDRISKLELNIERNKNTLQRLDNELEALKAKEATYEENKEAIENLESLIRGKRKIEKQLTKKKDELSICETEVLNLHRAIGSLGQKVRNIKDQKAEYIELREQFAAYDLYMQCMHPNGIAYDVIKKKLPVINQEIAKVLANLTTFEVLFEEDGNKLDILIKHPSYDPRPLSMASGAEKTMAAMAIRLALMAVSNLPASDIIVLDEPGTALDEEHLQAFTQLLDMIKVHFKTIFLISHLDSLKDVVDTTLDISRKEDYAFINQ
jgi:DNA repair exonuclease SbcCD nuclease subunit